MRYLARLAILLSASTASADDAAVAAILDQALQEQRVIQTCTALIPDESGRTLAFWQETVGETLAVIAAAGARPANLTTFAASALPGGLLPSANTPWSEVLALCNADPEWRTRWVRFDIVILPRAVEEALAQ